MDTVDQSFGFLSNLNLTIPLSQIAIFCALSALCLIVGKHKIGTLMAYGFLFYWVFILNQGFFMKNLEKTAGGVYIYGAIGFVMALIGFVGFLKKTE
ncbi:MAG: hypothetical protein O3A78_09160 [Nitrospinae bacterium]|jgi:hypothetical protein|nr:hypothetical protein [Nitrospinota bacterium]MDA1109960.1 hypothetical protein [Nitrospinota bacterium]